MQKPPPEPVPTRSPFSVPVFRAIWLATLASNFGGLIQSVGASWMMTALHASPLMIALVQTSTTLPLALLSLWAGAVADNLDRRRIMLVAQVFMMIISATLTVFAWLNLMTPWLLLTFTFLIGCGMAANSPAWQASVGDVVPRESLPSAVTMNSMGFNFARSLGPALGGVIVATFGVAAAFVVNAFTYTGLIFVLVRWRPKIPPRILPRERIGHAMIAGLKYATMSPPIRRVLLRGGLFGLVTSAVAALVPLVACDLLGGGPLIYGALLGAFGFGAVIGALSSPVIRRHLPSENIVRYSTLALIVGSTTTALSSEIVLTFPALALAGSGWVLALSTFNATVQISSPRWVVGRMLAIYQMAAFGGMAIGSSIFGAVANGHGVAIALMCAAAGQVAVVLIGLRLPLPPMTFLDLEPLDRFQTPITTIPMEPRSGPIVVTIEYRIAAADIMAFLAAMTERARIRRRDGAQHWTLLRDLIEPELWIEHYRVPTWLEYLRHNQRRTKADVANSRSLLALHSGEGAPRIHRMVERQTSSLPWARGTDPREITDSITDPTQSS